MRPWFLLIHVFPLERKPTLSVGPRAMFEWKEDTMKLVGKTLASAALGAGLLAASAVSASAAIVCSGNVCWHTHERLVYPPEARVIIHDDDWRWEPHERYTFREHEGRGYWRGGDWVEW